MIFPWYSHDIPIIFLWYSYNPQCFKMSVACWFPSGQRLNLWYPNPQVQQVPATSPGSQDGNEAATDIQTRWYDWEYRPLSLNLYAYIHYIYNHIYIHLYVYIYNFILLCVYIYTYPLYMYIHIRMCVCGPYMIKLEYFMVVLKLDWDYDRFVGRWWNMMWVPNLIHLPLYKYLHIGTLRQIQHQTGFLEEYVILR